MNIRKLISADRPAFEKLCSVCFMYAINVDEVQKKAEENQSDPHGYGAFAPDGEMMAGMIGNELTMNFDGRPEKLLGIGGVVTHPAFRRDGAIRNIMRAILRNAREEGYAFSGLYPFSHAFYRKFGFELARDDVYYTFPVSSIAKYLSPLHAKMLLPDDDLSALHDVYRTFSKRYILSIDRDEKAFRRYVCPNPYAANQYTYAIREGEKVVSYVCFTKKSENSENILKVTDFAFTDEQAFIKILGLLARFSAEFNLIEMMLPDDIPLAALTDAPYSVSTKTNYHYMLRVLNTEAALKSLSRGDFRFVIEVNDDFLPENSGKWLVTPQSTESTDAPADLSLSIHAFSQLAAGYIGFESLMFKNDAKVFSNEETLERVFGKKPSQLGVYF